MSSGIIGRIGFADILVSEVTMLIACVLFLICCGLLIFKRKQLTQTAKSLAVTGFVVTGLYLAFIIFMVVMWG